MKIKDYIKEYIFSDEYIPQNKEQIRKSLGIEKKDRKIFYSCLDELVKDGILRISSNNNYIAIKEEDKKYIGTLQGNQKGFAFFISDNPEQEDIFISPDNLNKALNKDKVRIEIINNGDIEKGESPEGKVVEILERNRGKIVGTYFKNKNFGFVVPDDNKYYNDIFIPKNKEMNAKDGYKVVCKIDTFEGKNPEGHIIEVLGSPKEAGVDILSIVKEFDVPYEFSKETLEEASKIKLPEKKDFEGRKDLRNLFTVTIDGKDAKDFDDAISAEKNGDNYILYVHIADVSHYVKKGSNIDKEAYERGNSIYLVNKVIPMLPTELSNEACSLQEGEDRLTLTVKMLIDEKGKVLEQEFFESVICSNHRLIYEDVSNYIEDGIKFSDEELNYNVDIYNEIYKILREAKEKRGAIDFNTQETYIEVDDNGHPIDVRPEKRREANRLIEEFMLITNETVATFFSYLEIPFIYRIHDKPDEDKIEEFKKIISRLGYKIEGKRLHPKDFQKLTNEIAGKPEEMMINNLMLRSMKKAEYDVFETSHFGLALEYYTHFTAPIRRYSDLSIHRIIKAWINGNSDTASESTLEDIAYQCSDRELKSLDLEREVIDLKSCEYMEDYIGYEYDGIISSLTNFGIFVQLENTIEVLVHFRNMDDDYYDFDEENYQVIGERQKKVFKIGQKIRIKVIDVNIVQKEIDAIIV